LETVKNKFQLNPTLCAAASPCHNFGKEFAIPPSGSVITVAR
jgi:hypothetical protein